MPKPTHHPWREVLTSERFRGGYGAPWWRLHLACGHTIERIIPPRKRAYPEVPERTRCPECGEAK